MTLSERKAGMPPPVLVVALRNRYVLERELGRGGGYGYIRENLIGRRPIGAGVLSSAYGLGGGAELHGGLILFSLEGHLEAELF